LRHWRLRAAELCRPWALALALDALGPKAFHSMGGGVYATGPGVLPAAGPQLMATIVALLSDYLDSLVDGAGCSCPRAHRLLHQAFVDAFTAGPSRDYFSLFPWGSDGGYLNQLVAAVREGTRGLPGYAVVRPFVERLAYLYAGMQSRKHGPPGWREQALQRWWQQVGMTDLPWWEFAAACGSTLGIFALLWLASRPDATVHEARQLMRAYFPHLCCLHIILDYLIDRHEDHQSGDLNFTRQYPSIQHAALRLVELYRRSEHSLRSTPAAALHLMVLRGLIGLYLSDPKAQAGEIATARELILRHCGIRCRIFHRGCTFLRRTGIWDYPIEPGVRPAHNG